jgi:hypothetical protein
MVKRIHMIHCDSTGFKMSSYFVARIAARFAPLNFLGIHGYPNQMPHIDEWDEYFPSFSEKKEDNPAQHLLEFHQCMDQLDIYHEDVLMKMFMFSLGGDARQWYKSLSPSSISSLKEFHATFNKHCKRVTYFEPKSEVCDDAQSIIIHHFYDPVTTHIEGIINENLCYYYTIHHNFIFCSSFVLNCWMLCCCSS